jgi:hypothetical protein
MFVAFKPLDFATSTVRAFFHFHRKIGIRSPDTPLISTAAANPPPTKMPAHKIANRTRPLNLENKTAQRKRRANVTIAVSIVWIT